MRKTLHLVGNAHIDPVWLWTAAEGRQEVLDTCRAAVELMDEHPDFVFCRSSAATYRWIEETDPDLFERIRSRIAEGRWVVVGGWWVQPDCNVPSGESLIRQALHGQRYFRDRLRREPVVGYNVDTFGHPHTLAQLLSGMGLKYYVFFRPGAHEKQLPGPVFWWEGPDGSRVLASRPPGHYNTGPAEIEDRVREAAAAIRPDLTEGMAFYGVGNHGGGPTRANLQSIDRLNGEPDLPELRHSHPQAFFAAVAAGGADFPVVRDELQYHARGCYTSVAAIKAANRRAEGALQDAEVWAALAGVLTGRPADRARLDACWETVLFNQFHDILAGTSIQAACRDTVDQNQRVVAEARDAAQGAARAIAARVSRTDEGEAVVLLNPLGWERREVVECETNWRNVAPSLRLETPAGEDVPVQLLSSEWSGGGRSVRFLAKAIIPSCGYETLSLKPDSTGARGGTAGTGREISNGLVRVMLGAGIAWIAEIVDLESGARPTAPGCGGFVVLDDPSDTWSHGIDRFRNEVGRFEMTGAPQLLEGGPLRWRVRVEGRWGNSCLCQEMILLAGRRAVDVRVTVDWHERHKMLKLCVPTRIEAEEAAYEAPYGVMVRPQTGDEEPGQRWVDVSGTLDGEPYGVALLNDCKYGFDVLDGEIRMSVLRSPIYAFHDPAQVQPGETYAYTDQGRHVFRYAIVPHPGDWRAAGIARLAAEFNRPCLVLHEPEHDGLLPTSYSLAATDKPNIDVETIKPAEHAEGIAIRLRETSGQAADCALTIAGATTVHLAFRAWEIKTLVATRCGEEWLACEADLLERPLADRD